MNPAEVRDGVAGRELVNQTFVSADILDFGFLTRVVEREYQIITDSSLLLASDFIVEQKGKATLQKTESTKSLKLALGAAGAAVSLVAIGYLSLRHRK